MKRIILFPFLLILTSCSSSIGNGEMISNSRESNEISAVEGSKMKEEQILKENQNVLEEKSAISDDVVQEEMKSYSEESNWNEIDVQEEENIEIIEEIEEVSYPELPIEESAENFEQSKINFLEFSSLTYFLKKNVSPTGKVNYAKIKANLDQLGAIIRDFEENYPTPDWSKNEKLVYWINAYNVYTLKLVAPNYPVSSIKDITAKPWDKKYIQLGGSTLSLNDIEHIKIRANYNEPRIHFALNCASVSCPILLNKAFTVKSLNYQLTAMTKRFFKDPTKNDFSNPKSVKISSLFNWYKEDFVKKEGSVIQFINKYRTEQLESPKISYLEYDWNLND